MASYYEISKINFLQWFTAFSQVAIAHADELNLDESSIAAISEALEELSDALHAQGLARAAAMGATTLANERYRKALELTSQCNAQFQAMPGLSSALLGNLGLNVPGSASPTPVSAPKELVISPSANGVNTLSWSRNGNAPRTTYIIEADFKSGGGWQMIGATTRSKFQHTGQVPGRTVFYRVIAQRGKSVSPPSQSNGTYIDNYSPRAA